MSKAGVRKKRIASSVAVTPSSGKSAKWRSHILETQLLRNRGPTLIRVKELNFPRNLESVRTPRFHRVVIIFRSSEHLPFVPLESNAEVELPVMHQSVKRHAWLILTADDCGGYGNTVGRNERHPVLQIYGYGKLILDQVLESPSNIAEEFPAVPERSSQIQRLFLRRFGD